MSRPRLPLLFLIVAMAAHFAIVVRHHARPLITDELYYAAKARWIAAHGTFAPVDASERDVVAGRVWGTSDWRPQGYPLFLAAVAIGAIEDDAALRLRATVVQYLLLALLLVQLQRIVDRTTTSLRARWLSALLLALSPWPFEYANDVGPDTVNAVLVTAALLLAWRWVSSPERGPGAFFVAMLAASSTLLFRPEMIAMAPALALAALVLRHRFARVTARDVAAGVLAFALVTGLQVAYRWHVTGAPGLFGALRIRNAGAFEWTRTWIGTEKEAYDFVYAITESREASVPDRAFANDGERAQVALAMRIARERGYTREVDGIFRALAEKRRRERPLLWLGVRALNVPQLWLHLETNSTLLDFLAPWPRALRRPLLGGLLLLKIAAVLLGLLGIARSVRRWLRHEEDTFDALILLCGVYIVARTLFVGLVLDWRVHRYVTSAWPPMLLCAASVFVSPRPARPTASPAP